MENTGKIIVFSGIVLILAGLVVWQFSDKSGWFGNLPGDIKIERENFRFYAPITTMLIISIILTVFIWLARKFF